MNKTNFDILHILSLLARRWKFLLFFSLGALALGLVFSLLQPKTYRSQATFIVKSPMTTDRNHLLRQGFYQNQEFFAREDEIDHVLSIAEGSGLKSTLVQNFDLAALHNGSSAKAYKALEDNMRIKRLETKNIELRIEDRDPERARQMVEGAYHIIESKYRDFFKSTKEGMVAALDSLGAELATAIAKVSDSIEQVRSRYQLYNQLLPGRGMVLQSAGSVSPEQAKGLEKLQILTTEKDKLLEDDARYASLKNEYKLGLQGSGPHLLYLIEYPSFSEEPVKPILWLNLLISLLCGFAFACLLVLLGAAFSSGKPKA